MSASERPERSDAPAGPARLRRAARLAGGFTLLAVGGALLVLPGPGIPVVLGGLALLAPEVSWARRLRGRIHERVRGLRRSLAGDRT